MRSLGYSQVLVVGGIVVAALAVFVALDQSEDTEADEGLNIRKRNVHSGGDTTATIRVREQSDVIGQSSRLQGIISLWQQHDVSIVTYGPLQRSLVIASLAELGCGDDLSALIAHLHAIGVSTVITSKFGEVNIFEGPDGAKRWQELRNSNYSKFPQPILKSWADQLRKSVSDSEFEAYVDDIYQDQTDFSRLLKLHLVEMHAASDPVTSFAAALEVGETIDSIHFAADAGYRITTIIQQLPETVDYGAIEEILRTSTHEKREKLNYELFARWSGISPEEAIAYIVGSDEVDAGNLKTVGESLKLDNASYETIEEMISSAPEGVLRDQVLHGLVERNRFDLKLARHFGSMISNMELRKSVLELVPSGVDDIPGG
jgi:hypothetical protein